ncbi:MAG: class I SAM-dependent methyltransferase [Anaerolineales bacterium]|nr:class I SAM-dependent methyltransferase [Anaerolineales bacterium]
MSNSQQDLIAFWKDEEQKPFSGWDFSYVHDRWHEEKPPWSYSEMVRECLPKADSLLDLGTGGGERLLKFQDLWPAKTVVTEEWEPNFLLASERLEPLGVEVVNVASDEIRPLPFPDNSFDLVISRHTAYNLAEVERILTPGGTFLTQQVNGRWLQDLIGFMGGAPQWPYFNLKYTLEKLFRETNLHLQIAESWTGTLTFYDIGALVYYLKAVPWLVENFSVDTHLDKLLALQARIDSGEPLRFKIGKLMFKAQKGDPWANEPT